MKTDTFWDRFIAEHTVGRLTVLDLRDALAGFPIPVEALPALLREIQIAVLSSDRAPTLDRKRFKKNIQAVARVLKTASAKVKQLTNPRGYWIGVAARKRARGDKGRSSGGIAPVVFADEDRLAALVIELAWAEEFLNETAALIPSHGPRWRQRATRDRFVRLACELAPIYKSLTGKRATFDNWPESDSQGPWPDFYTRIAGLVFGPATIPDLKGVLEDAARQPKSLFTH